MALMSKYFIKTSHTIDIIANTFDISYAKPENIIGTRKMKPATQSNIYKYRYNFG